MTSFDLSSATEFEFYWNPVLLRNFESSEYFHVYGGVNHHLDCPSDEFYLKSSLFEIGVRGDDFGKVRFFEILLNGSKNLLVLDNPSDVKIKYPRFHKLFSSVPPPPEVFQISSIQRDAFGKTEQLARLPIFSLVDERISHILQVASLGNNFINLFKIMETIKSDEDVVENGFALTDEETAELKRFEYTANSPAVIGIYARHGVNEKKFKIAKSLTPMSLEEGHAFVSSLFIRYINLKYKHYPNWR